MNFFKLACNLLFKKKSDAVYHSVINVLKTTAPVTQPIVESLLASKGLPSTPSSALQVLAEAAASTKALPAPVVDGLAAVLSQSMVLVPPQK